MPHSFKQGILILGAIANLLTVLLYMSAIRQDSGAAMAFVLVEMPLLWIATILIAIYLIWTYRKAFKPVRLKLYVMLLFIFCTPIPVGLLYAII